MVSQLKHKKTEIGKIPGEWKILKIGNILSLEYGEGLTAKYRKGDKYPVYGSNGIIGYNSEYLVEGPGIIVGRKGTIGSVNWSEINYWPIDTTYYIKLKETEIDLKWLSNKLLVLGLLKLNMATGTPGLNRDLVYNLYISIPPLPEQKKISEVLSTVDNAIEEVDESITRTEQLKKGLMQELLTKGIGHKEFKETEIGKLPEEWKVVKLGDESIIEIRGNRTINGFDKVAFIPMEIIPDSNIFTKFEIRSMKCIKSFTYCENGDILLAKITPSLENEKQGIVPDDVPNGFALATTEVFPIFCKDIEKLFMFYILKYPKFRRKIIASMTGTTGRQRASKVCLKNLLIPLPFSSEQNKIAEILTIVDKNIQLLKEKKNKLERVKKGLMNDLLTGRKRVKVEV